MALGNVRKSVGIPNCLNISNIVHKGIRALLNLFIFLYIFFLQEDFTRTKSTKTHTSEQKQKKQHFYAHKKQLRGGKWLVRLFESL